MSLTLICYCHLVGTAKIVRGSTLLYDHETPLLDDLADLLYSSGIATTCCQMTRISLACFSFSQKKRQRRLLFSFARGCAPRFVSPIRARARGPLRGCLSCINILYEHWKSRTGCCVVTELVSAYPLQSLVHFYLQSYRTLAEWEFGWGGTSVTM